MTKITQITQKAQQNVERKCTEYTLHHDADDLTKCKQNLIKKEVIKNQ